MRIGVEHRDEAVCVLFEISPDVNQCGVFLRCAYSTFTIKLRQVWRKKIGRQAQMNVHEMSIQRQLRLGVSHVSPEVRRQFAFSFVAQEIIEQVMSQRRELRQRLGEKLVKGGCVVTRLYTTHLCFRQPNHRGGGVLGQHPEPLSTGIARDDNRDARGL